MVITARIVPAGLAPTTRLAKVEANQNANDTTDDESKAEEVELCNMLLQRLATVRVEVQEEEKYRKGNTSRRPRIDTLIAVNGTPVVASTYRLMKKHLKTSDHEY